MKWKKFVLFFVCLCLCFFSFIFFPFYTVSAATYPEWYQYDSTDFYGENTIICYQGWHIVEIYSGHRAVRAQFRMSNFYGFVPQVLYISQYPIDNLYLEIYGIKAVITIEDSETIIAEVNLDELDFETRLIGDTFSFYTQLDLERRKFIPVPLHNYSETSTDDWIVTIIIPMKDGTNTATVLNALRHTLAFGSYYGVQNYLTLINTATEEAGYNAGYNDGYNDGFSGSISSNWFISFVNSVFDILNIEIFPNVRLIYLIFIPVGLGVLALIFKLIRG